MFLLWREYFVINVIPILNKDLCSFVHDFPRPHKIALNLIVFKYSILTICRLHTMQSRVSLVAKHANPQCHMSFLKAGGDSTQTEEKLALKSYYLIGQTLSLKLNFH